MENLKPITNEEILMNGDDLKPYTRREKILAGVYVEPPYTRIEKFLMKYRHAGGDVMVEGLEVTANGTYTAPEGKAYSPVEVAVPLPDNAYLLKTASGPLVSFSDGADLPMPSFVCNIDAVQDLHGYEAPWVGGGNINLFDIKAKLTDNARTYTMGGITYTRIDDSDGNALSVKGTGTATEYSFCDIPVTLPAGRYKTNVSGSDSNKMGLNLRNSDRSYFKEGNTEFTFTEQTSIYIRYLVASGNIANNTITCMLYKYDGTNKDFVPYSNICPISGHTGVNAWVRGKNLLPNVMASSTTLDGITATKDDNGVITLTGHGEGSVNPFFYLVGEQGVYPLFLRAGQYTLSQGVVLPTNTMLRVVSNTETVAQCQNVDNVSFTLTKDAYVSVYVRVDKNADFTTPVKVYPMIRLADQSAEYEPYNPNSQTIQVSWQTEAGEVYGGYVDLVSGVLTVTHKSKTGFTRGGKDSSNKLYYIDMIADMKTFSDANNISPYYIDSMFEKMSLRGAREAETPSITHHNKTLYVGGYIGKEAELDTLLETLQVKYELDTPITYQLTPQQIKSLLGKNNAWCSTGDVDIDYFAKEV